MLNNTNSMNIDENNNEERFSINKIISDTLQGRMYQGIDKLTNKFVAIKETWKVLVNIKQCRQGTPIKEDYFNEINILKYLSSKIDCPSSIIGIISSWEENQCYMYAMEYCDCCLFNYMKKIHEKGLMKVYCDAMKKLPQRTMNFRESTKNPFLKYVQNIFIKLTNTVNYLHENNIVHLDLSLENIMLNDKQNRISDPSIKIIDFGLAKYFGQNATNFNLIEKCGKNAYMAPEVYDDNKYYDGRKADIWSLGIILFIMLIGTHLVDKPCYKTDERFCYLMKDNKFLNKGSKGGIRMLLKTWRRLRLINDDVLDLLNKIFQYEHKRIDMKQLLKHPFLDPNRYYVQQCEYVQNHHHEEMYIEETTPTPSSIDTLSDYYYDDFEEDEKSHNIDCDDTESTLSSINFRGFDLEQNNNQKPQKIDIDIADDNDDDDIKNNDSNPSNNIPARVDCKKSISEIEDDDFITPRIGIDGMFKFGIVNNNNDNKKNIVDSKNNHNNIHQKYQF